MFKEITDIKTTNQLNLPVPEAEYEYETLVLKPTDAQNKMVENLPWTSE